MVRQAELKAQALKIESETEIEELVATQKAELDHRKVSLPILLHGLII